MKGSVATCDMSTVVPIATSARVPTVCAEQLDEGLASLWCLNRHRHASHVRFGRVLPQVPVDAERLLLAVGN